MGLVEDNPIKSLRATTLVGKLHRAISLQQSNMIVNNYSTSEYKLHKLVHIFIVIVATYTTLITWRLGFAGTALHAYLCTIGVRNS